MDKQDLPLPLCILMGITKQSPATQNLLSCSPQSYDPNEIKLPFTSALSSVRGHSNWSCHYDLTK